MSDQGITKRMSVATYIAPPQHSLSSLNIVQNEAQVPGKRRNRKSGVRPENHMSGNAPYQDSDSFKRSVAGSPADPRNILCDGLRLGANEKENTRNQYQGTKRGQPNNNTPRFSPSTTP